MEERCLLSAGAFDPTFGTGGVASPGTSIKEYGNAIALYPDAQGATAGDVVAAGYVTEKNGNQDFALFRYTPSGKPDASFGKNGEVTTAVSSYGYAAVQDVAIQADGKVVVVGYGSGTSVKGNSYDFVVARYNVNGSLDTTFGSGGLVTTNFSGSGDARHASYDYPTSVFIQPDGKIVAAGITCGPTDTIGPDNHIALVRYNSNGTLDTSFGVGGKVSTAHTVIPGSLADPSHPTQGDTWARDAVLQADGKILVSGYTEVTAGLSTSYEAFVVRYNSNGTLDNTFGTGGAVSLPPVNTSPYAGSYGHVALRPDGEIVVSGFGQVALLHSDGSFDTTFGNSNTGIVPQGFGPLAIEPNGDIVTSGYGWVDGLWTPELTRFLPNGSVDGTFGTGGTMILQTGFANFAAIAILPNGKIDVAGNGFLVDRLLPDAPQIGVLTSSANPVTTGASLTLTASQITDINPGATISQVAFYRDANGNGKLDTGTDTLLGYGTRTSAGVWSLTFTLPSTWTPGSYTLLAQARDNFGVVGDPLAITETVS